MEGGVVPGAHPRGAESVAEVDLGGSRAGREDAGVVRVEAGAPLLTVPAKPLQEMQGQTAD